MKTNIRMEELRNRNAPLEMNPDEFRELGYQMVDRIAEFIHSLPQRSVTRDRSLSDIQDLLVSDPLSDDGIPASDLLKEVTEDLFENSLFNGHPRFWGYITSSAAPIGALGDFLAAAVNPNVGAWSLSPMASEIEAQTIRWIAEMLDYPTDCGGLLVSGGNVANFIGFLAARKAKAKWDVRTQGLLASQKQMRVYVSQETHTWIQKAADLFGLGTDAIRWILTDESQRMDMKELEKQVQTDMEAGESPFLVVGTAGSVSTGAIDPLHEISAFCREKDLWFHVDGAYGAIAAVMPDAPDDLNGLAKADSIAMDPHKWLYSPLEAGCTLVRDPKHLVEAFSFHPEYYWFDSSEEAPATNFYEFGLQNSRGFRALKVWLALRQVGRSGYIQMIRDDVALASVLYELVDTNKVLQAYTHSLSITTFRYLPEDLATDQPEIEDYLNDLNKELLDRLQSGGQVYVSNAVIEGAFVLRACIVNFRTTLDDIEALPEIVVRIGKEVDSEIRPQDLKI